MTEKQIAAILKIGFLLQYFPKKSIQDWGRFKVEKGGWVAFFDLTFSHPQEGEIISLLNKISGSNNDEVIKEYFFGFYGKLLRSNQFPIRLLEKEIIKFFEMDVVELSEEEIQFFLSLDADYSLWKDGTLSEPNIEHFSFLDHYTTFDQIQLALSAESIPEPTFPS